MKVRLMPDPDQVRWYALAALSGFGTLPTDEAEAFARDAIQSLLDYLEALDATNYASFEHGSEAIKLARELELRVRDLERGNLPDLKISGA